MRTLIFLLLASSFITPVFSQIDVSFKKETVSFSLSQEDKVHVVSFVNKASEEKVEDLDLVVDIDYEKTTLEASKFNITFAKTKLSELQDNNTIFVQLVADTTSKDVSKIILHLKFYRNDELVKDVNTGDHGTLEITVNPMNSKLQGYEYLAYVGTNFDLVEGIKAKDLFFAGNIYRAPKSKTHKKAVGFYLSLYGNRAFTQVDSSGLARRVTRYEPLTDTTYQVISGMKFLSTKRTTDNIGSYISPLIQLKWFRNNDEKSNLKLYYSPSLEFVYRRTKISFEDTGIIVNDSIRTVQGNLNDVLPLNNETPLFSDTFNEYSFNAGIIGLFLSLENKDISVRVHASVGYSSNYYVRFVNSRGIQAITTQRSDIFFSGRAWITEPHTGLTLQAEVTNSAINPRPFFVATLSKAFNFRKLGSIFQPITSR